MLKSKRDIVTACSLSSCRIKAEALARAFNTRLWPCSWVARRSSAERDDGMSNGIDDEEEFFDASPSPVEIEDAPLLCQEHSSAATEAGRAKLYELLQQHVSDDAIDVFYDVSEDAGVTETASDMCLKDDMKHTDQVNDLCESPKYCTLDSEPFLNNEDNNEVTDDELSENQSKNILSENEIPNFVELINGEEADANQIDSDPSILHDSTSEDCREERVNDEIKFSEENIHCIIDGDKIMLIETKSSCICEELNSVNSEQDHLKEEVNNDLSSEKNEVANDISEYDDLYPNLYLEENFSNSLSAEQIDSNAISETTENKTLENNDDIKVEIEITETNSPSPTSDVPGKAISPTSSRLQVFDESRPKISRSTSLKTGKTPPGTPSRKKIVRFADVLGLDLEDVHHIMTGDVPIIPSSAYTDLDLEGIDLPTCEPISETVEIKSRQSNCWNTVQGATATNVIYPMFSIPGEQPDFMDRVRNQGACLETLVVSEMSVQCTCRVMNFGFHKKLVARYTVNDWLSSNDIDASYVQGSSNGETDGFGFSIFLSPFNRNVKFALKYVVNGKEYWDNNRGQNYCLSYHENDHMQQATCSLWQHQFW